MKILPLIGQLPKVLRWTVSCWIDHWSSNTTTSAAACCCSTGNQRPTRTSIDYGSSHFWFGRKTPAQAGLHSLLRPRRLFVRPKNIRLGSISRGLGSWSTSQGQKSSIIGVIVSKSVVLPSDEFKFSINKQVSRHGKKLERNGGRALMGRHQLDQLELKQKLLMLVLLYRRFIHKVRFSK